MPVFNPRYSEKSRNYVCYVLQKECQMKMGQLIIPSKAGPDKKIEASLDLYLQRSTWHLLSPLSTEVAVKALEKESYKNQ